MLITGEFTSVNGTNRNGIARLNADGSLDSSFNLTPGQDCPGLLRSGRSWTARYSSGVRSAALTARLADSLRASMPMAASTAVSVRATKSVPRFHPSRCSRMERWSLEGGSFTGLLRHGMARLNANGTLDTSFDPQIIIGRTSFLPRLQKFFLRTVATVKGCRNPAALNECEVETGQISLQRPSSSGSILISNTSVALRSSRAPLRIKVA